MGRPHGVAETSELPTWCCVGEGPALEMEQRACIMPKPPDGGFAGTVVRARVPSSDVQLQRVGPWLRHQQFIIRLLRTSGQRNSDKTRVHAHQRPHVEMGCPGAGSRAHLAECESKPQFVVLALSGGGWALSHSGRSSLRARCVARPECVLDRPRGRSFVRGLVVGAGGGARPGDVAHALRISPASWLRLPRSASPRPRWLSDTPRPPSRSLPHLRRQIPFRASASSRSSWSRPWPSASREPTTLLHCPLL